MEYDQIIPLAKNDQNDIISACKWGSLWYFAYESKTGDNSGRIGDHYATKYEILAASENYIINDSGYNFSKKDILQINNKTMVLLSKDQIVAINTAIRLLENDTSDHAEQASFYLKTIIK